MDELLWNINDKRTCCDIFIRILRIRRIDVVLYLCLSSSNRARDETLQK